MTDSSDRYEKLQAEVVAAHTRLDSVNERLGSMETSVRGMATDIKALLQREPSKLPFWALGGVLGVLLTILALVVTPMYASIANNAQRIAHHDDGHPAWVKRDLDNMDRRLTERMLAIDKLHAEEHVEQEHDIAELRAADARTEERNDKQDDSLIRLSTIAEERTKRFASTIDNLAEKIDVKAADRWTASQQREHEKAIQWQLKNHSHEGISQ